MLPTRPAVTSAWGEIAAAYREVQTPGKPERVELGMVLARLLDQGAGDTEGAFAELEQALVILPDHAGALAALDDLAARHDAGARQIAAYEHLVGEVTLPEHLVAYSLRLAALHHQAGNLERAEACYRNVLGVLPQHEAALEALAAIYDAAGRDREYVEIRSRLVDLQAPSAPPAEREAMIRGLVRDLDQRLHRLVDATRRLESLARELPERVDIQEDLADLLARQQEWAAAAAVLEAALQSPAASGDARLRILARLATLEETHLGAANAAIGRWQAILSARAGDPEALSHLQELYLAARRWAELVEILDRRLAGLWEDDHEARIAILVVKAQALQEGFGDEAGATEILEALTAQDPENDAVILGLSRLYRRGGRVQEGVEVLRQRLAQLPPDALDARATLTLALASILADELGEPAEAMAVIEEILAEHPSDPALLQERARLARILGDVPVLVDALGNLGEPAGLLEAADLARHRLGDAEWAARLSPAVIAAADKQGLEPAAAARLSAAIEGLVHLRIAAGDRAGADALIHEHVSAIPSP
ncbi:MAG: hypothetical protein H6710_21695, partial [Myxococcales bacterium]|nr:hypothetical protein [Myxococcales bacterium]